MADGEAYRLPDVLEGDNWVCGDVAAVPRPVRDSIAAILAEHLDRERADYLANCSDEPGGNQRRGHPYEHLIRVDRWLRGLIRGGQVETCAWIPDPSPEPHHQGCIVPIRRKTVGEVADELRLLLRDGHEGGEESPIRVFPSVDRDQAWPPGQIICYARPGGCEGWYTCVEVIDDDVRVPGSALGTPMHAVRVLLIAKTLSNEDGAYALARRLTWILAGE